ncbi:MAG: hypothetical protein WD672_06145, partial [Woeseia sp.]
GSATVKGRELLMVSRVVTLDCQETRKCNVGAFSMPLGGGLRQVPAADGANRIVAYRRSSGDSLWAVIDRVAARRLRECPSWHCLTGSRIYAKLLPGKTISTPTSLRYINDTRWLLSAPQELKRLMQASSGSSDSLNLPSRLRSEDITRSGSFDLPTRAQAMLLVFFPGA